MHSRGPENLPSQDPAERLIFALDLPDASSALEWAGRLRGRLHWLKVGPVLFTAAGPTLVKALVQMGFRVFLDLKFHDIPTVVAGAVREAVRLGVSMLTVHSTGGELMMRAAAQAASAEALVSRVAPPVVLGVTVLTSLDGPELLAQGCLDSPMQAVLRRASLAQAAGLDGVVCSALEAKTVRAAAGRRLTLLTPGIRPSSLQDHGPRGDDDQARVATPTQAIVAGADFLVVGRPIRDAIDPLAMLQALQDEISEALITPTSPPTQEYP